MRQSGCSPTPSGSGSWWRRCCTWDRTSDPERFTDVDPGSVLGEAAELAYTLGDIDIDIDTARRWVERGRRMLSRPEDFSLQTWVDLAEHGVLKERDRELPLSQSVDVVTAIREQPPAGRSPEHSTPW